MTGSVNSFNPLTTPLFSESQMQTQSGVVEATQVPGPGGAPAARSDSNSAVLSHRAPLDRVE